MKKVLKKLAKMQKEFAVLYNSTGLVGINNDWVHLTEEMFLEWFSDYTVHAHTTEYPFKLEAEAYGVKFGCIAEELPEKNAPQK